MKKEKKKKKMGKRKNPWLDHLKEYQGKHKDKSYGECMAEAKKTYVKK